MSDSTTKPNRVKPMSRLTVIVVVLIVAAGVGGYAAYRYLNKSPGTTGSIDPGRPEVRAHREVPAIRFTDVTEKSGIRFKHFNGATPQKLLPETMGGGVVIFDYDGDGKPDILFTNGRPWPGQPAPADGMPTMKLYRNKGNFEFEDVTEKVGLNVPMFGMGVTVGDFETTAGRTSSSPASASTTSFATLTASGSRTSPTRQRSAGPVRTCHSTSRRTSSLNGRTRSRSVHRVRSSTTTATGSSTCLSVTTSPGRLRSTCR